VVKILSFSLFIQYLVLVRIILCKILISFFKIKKGSMEDAIAVSNQIPALKNPQTKEVYKIRIKEKNIRLTFDD